MGERLGADRLQLPVGGGGGLGRETRQELAVEDLGPRPVAAQQAGIGEVQGDDGIVGGFLSRLAEARLGFRIAPQQQIAEA